jgi:excisionase family DNA binding protein
MVDLPEGDFVSAQQACELLGVKPATLYAYVSRGLLQSYRQGARRQRLYRKSELNALREMPHNTADSMAGDLPGAETWVGER